MDLASIYDLEAQNGLNYPIDSELHFRDKGPAKERPPMIDTSSKRVRFHYIKSNFFRVGHVDGALGGWTGQGFLHMACYSERPAIPQITEHDVDAEKNVLSAATVLEGRTGFVREIDFDLMMSRDKAQEIRDWLTERLKEYDNMIGESEEVR
jgi:hypothetical protein